MEIVVRNLEELSSFAKEFLKNHPQGAIVGLSGELGAGKTAFVRACVAHLSSGETSPRVMSPTYVLHQRYTTTPSVDHLDLYRLENVDESALLELQYFDTVANAKAKHGFVFVEWPEKCVDKGILTLDLHLRLSHCQDGSRILSF